MAERTSEVLDELLEKPVTAGLQRPSPRGMERWRRTLTQGLRVGVILVLFGGWEVLANWGYISSFFWSQPSKIWETAIQYLFSGKLIPDILFTFQSTLWGFVIGTLAGSALGLSFWWSRLLSDVVEPYVIVFHAIPKLGLAPLVILVFGIGFASKLFMAVALTIVVAILTAYNGTRTVDRDLETLLYSLGASKWQVFTKVVFPSTLPWIISSLKINIGLALAGAIVGEFVGSQKGLGHLIIFAEATYEIGLIWVGVFVLSGLALLMYFGVLKLERMLLRGIVHTL